MKGACIITSVGLFRDMLFLLRIEIDISRDEISRKVPLFTYKLSGCSATYPFDLPPFSFLTLTCDESLYSRMNSNQRQAIKKRESIDLLFDLLVRKISYCEPRISSPCILNVMHIVPEKEVCLFCGSH